MWSHAFGGKGDDRAYDVAVLPAGGFAFAGVNGSEPVGDSRAWMVITGDDGFYRHGLVLGDSGFDTSSALTVVGEDGLALTGLDFSQGSGDGSGLARPAASYRFRWLASRQRGSRGATPRVGGTRADGADSAHALAGNGRRHAGRRLLQRARAEWMPRQHGRLRQHVRGGERSGSVPLPLRTPRTAFDRR